MENSLRLREWTCRALCECLPAVWSALTCSPWDRGGVEGVRGPSLCASHRSCLSILLTSGLGTCEPCIRLTMETVGSGHQPLR